jgi:D-alanyl-D-alanine carboxypeptidase
MSGQFTNIVAIADTFVKTAPVDSSKLPPEGLETVKAGTSLLLDRYEKAGADHLKVTYPSGIIRYVYAPHFTYAGKPITFAPAIPKYVPLPVSETDRSLDHLQPVFRLLVIELIQKAAAQGIKLFINETLRTFDRQRYLYAQGRTRPGAIVTHAPPGKSNHHYGVAIDCYPIIGGKVDYNFDKHSVAMRQMNAVYDIAESIGLECGARGATGNFIDLPHIQLKNSNSSKLIALYPQGYIPGASKEIV